MSHKYPIAMMPVPAMMPRLCQRLSPSTKARCRSIYKKFKFGSITASYGALIADEGKQLVIDMGKNQLAKYSYHKIAAIGLYPLLQGLAWYVYIFGTFNKVKIVAVVLSRLSSEGVKTAIKLSGVPFAPLDLVLFGEFVPLTDNLDLSFVKNETIAVEDFVNILGNDK